MTDALYDYVATTGVIVPTTGELLSDVQTEFTGVLGTGLDLDSSTPQGIIIASEVAARLSVVQNNAKVANQINPNQSGGVFLDALCALSGLRRQSNTFTIVPNVVIAGVGGSPVVAGTLVQTSANDQFALQSDAELDPVTNQAVVTFVAVQPGPVPAPSGTWSILSDVLGLETVTNPDAATTLGTLQQSDLSLASLRRRTLSLQGQSTIGAILSAINAIVGVISSQGLENITASTATISGISMTAKSFWVCVDGPGVDPALIGEALLANKSGGSNWTGAQSVSVIEPISRQSYTARWDDPTLVPIQVQVTCSQGSFSGNPTTAVVQAVVDFGNNATVVPPGAALIEGFVVGQDASPFEIAAGVQAECPGLFIRSVQIQLVTSGGGFAPVELAMAINEKPTVIAANVSVVIV
jgi:hypothetical protein